MPMNRRSFLAASAAATSLASATNAHARADGRLKVLIPATLPEQLSELRTAAPEAELVECRSDNEMVEA
jgi:hypothetical protein